MIEYDIVSTGSKGNAIVINSGILIDCGVPFKKLRDCYKGLRLVLLTHIHSDHFNRTTIKRLAEERPTLRFGCCEWLVGDVLDCGVDKRNIDVYLMQGSDNNCFVYPEFCTIKIDKTVHNAENCAYHIWQGGESLFYATDTNSMNGIEAKNYNLYMIEANYNGAEILERIRRKQANGEYCHEHSVLKNHLSEEKALDWLYQNMGQNSQYIYMHEHEE